MREAQHAAVIKDELDAEREEEFAAARERRLLNDRMARNREKEKQLVDRFNALIDERRFDEALEVAGTLDGSRPDRRDAGCGSRFQRNSCGTII